MTPAPDSFLLRAALALQAQLSLIDASESENSYESSRTFALSAAAASIKMFEAAVGCPHPQSDKEEMTVTDVHIANDNVDPLAMFVDALQSDADERSLELLHRAAAMRCGAPLEDSIDVHNAWWSCSASLMQPSSDADSHIAHGTGRFQGFNPQAECEEVAPPHRYVTNQHCFAWPSHHFSSVLEGWCSLRAQASAPQVVPLFVYSFILFNTPVFCAHAQFVYSLNRTCSAAYSLDHSCGAGSHMPLVPSHLVVVGRAAFVAAVRPA